MIVESTPDPLEAKREAAAIKSTAAKLIMTRHRVEKLRAELVERDRSQSEVTTAAAAAIAGLAGADLATEIIETITADIADIEASALKITR